MKRVRSVLFLSVCAALRPNSGRRKTSVAANTKTEAAPLLAPTTTASLDETAVDAQRELSAPSLDAAPADVKGNRAPPKKAVTTPSDAKNNVLKLDWAKNKPCAFTPAALEPTEQRSYKDETDYPELALKYWADPRIHGWGNVGSSGAVHAFLAPTFTAGLDAFAYGGLDTRNAARDLTNTGSLDFCNDVTYKRHNAEATGLAGNRADVVSVFFLLHEAPAAARRQILREGFRLLAPGGTLALCDIHPEYNPSPIMLSGEPYLNGYLDKIDFEAAASAAKHGLRLHREVLVEGRLVLWTFQKAP